MTDPEYYSQATKRNQGIVSPSEQDVLKNKRVAVAGLGGVGGSHLLTLVRMGIGKFNISDIDQFGIVNINRQAGANSRTLGRRKTEVMAEMARDIHPDLKLKIFDEGVQPHNVDEFLSDVDVVVDAIDYFQMESRLLLYRTARRLGKPVVFSAPIGFSGTLHVFPAAGMSFEEYFDINDRMSRFDQLVAFTVGLLPRGTHWAYMDTRRVDLSEHAGPSIASACSIATGLLTCEVCCLLLGRRPPQGIPHYVQFDPYRRIYRQGQLRWGNRGPVQRLKRWIIAWKFRDQAALV
jgi:molybdopterin/thiamine biosynthesis adenylyltransferase